MCHEISENDSHIDSHLENCAAADDKEWPAIKFVIPGSEEHFSTMAFAGRLVEQTSFSNILLGPLLVVKKVADGEEKGAWAEVCQAFNSKVRYLAYEKVSCSESYQGNKG